MKQLSAEMLSTVVISKRKELNLRQKDLADKTGINRALISQIENMEFTPSVNQLIALCDVLGFDIDSVLSDPENKKR